LRFDHYFSLAFPLFAGLLWSGLVGFATVFYPIGIFADHYSAPAQISKQRWKGRQTVLLAKGIKHLPKAKNYLIPARSILAPITASAR
jgi:hypothetical protein